MQLTERFLRFFYASENTIIEGRGSVQAFAYLQEVSIFLFDKRSVEKLHKPKRRETVTDILRAGAARMERYSHPKLLQVRAYARYSQHANSLELFRSIRIYCRFREPPRRSIRAIFDWRCRRTKWRSARTRWPSPRSRSLPAWRTSWRTKSNQQTRSRHNPQDRWASRITRRPPATTVRLSSRNMSYTSWKSSMGFYR